MRAIILESESVSGPSGVVSLKTPTVPPYGLLRVCSVLVQDLDHDVATSIEFGVVSGTREIPVAITTTHLSKATGWYLDWNGYVDQGNAMYARIQGATDGDHVRLIVHGFICSLAQA